ncbi:aldo/keto reductase [bacterium]|nr:aldo/keto reductase [bacterium]
MKNISRREFIKSTISTAGAGTLLLTCGKKSLGLDPPGLVQLGDTGITVSRIAMGTGTHGTGRSSDQTRLGMEPFVQMAHHAYDSGIIFFDSADMYGSHTYIREALKDISRDKVVILSKIWAVSRPGAETASPSQHLERFLEELGTDYVDIVLLHCMTSPNWPTQLEPYCEYLAQAKEKGMVRAHGISCHNFGALQVAAESGWVDVLLARINHAGNRMDDTPEKVVAVLKQARARGAGILGMKIFGEGDLSAEDQRQQSLEFVWNSDTIHAMTIGFMDTGQMDDAIQRLNAIVKS